MLDKAIDQLLTRSEENNLVNKKEELTMTSVWDIIFGTTSSVVHYHCQMVMKKIVQECLNFTD